MKDPRQYLVFNKDGVIDYRPPPGYDPRKRHAEHEFREPVPVEYPDLEIDDDFPAPPDPSFAAFVRGFKLGVLTAVAVLLLLFILSTL